MDHRITIETATHATDSQGGKATTWSTYATVWAELKPVSAGERNFGQQLEYQRSHKCNIRYLAGVTTAMRVIFDSRYFHIKGIRAPDEKKFFMILDLDENVAS